MTQVYIGIGSNIERERHVAVALDSLHDLLGPLQVSPVYEAAAIGFDGKPFLNLVVGAQCSLAVGVLATALRRIERAHGYVPDAPKFSARSLDLDLLIYGDLCDQFEGVRLPRADILDCAYVLWPLADLAGTECHPVLRRSYVDLRAAFSAEQVLHKVAFVWRGRDLSR